MYVTDPIPAKRLGGQADLPLMPTQRVPSERHPFGRGEGALFPLLHVVCVPTIFVGIRRGLVPKGSGEAIPSGPSGGEVSPKESGKAMPSALRTRTQDYFLVMALGLQKSDARSGFERSLRRGAARYEVSQERNV
jgi:hypothetical protein